MDGDRDGDGGFERFVASRYGALVRAGYLLTGDRGLAEDLVQSALVHTLQGWKRVRDPDAFTRTVMYRLALRWGRRRWRGEVATAPADTPPVETGDVTAPVDDADAALRCLAVLPPAQRAVLVLRYYEQRSEAEVAALLGCSVGTVKSRSARALASLRAAGLVEDTRGVKRADA